MRDRENVKTFLKSYYYPTNPFKLWKGLRNAHFKLYKSRPNPHSQIKPYNLRPTWHERSLSLRWIGPVLNPKRECGSP